jgi:hypothetical protein
MMGLKADYNQGGKMEVTEVTVYAGRTFNHPHEDYSNLRPGVTLKATLAEGDDPIAATKQLQAKAEQLVEDHKQSMLKSLDDLYYLNERQREVMGLQKTLEQAQERLDEIRRQNPELPVYHFDNETGKLVPDGESPA